jgi:hypothetical protein
MSNSPGQAVAENAAPAPAVVCNSPSEPALRAVLTNSSNPAERVQAVRQLATLDPNRDPQVLRTVLVASADPTPQVRGACLWSLTQLKVWNRDVVEVVRHMLDDSDSSVRFQAMVILDKLGADHAPVSTAMPTR